MKDQLFHKKEIKPFIISGPCSAETEEQMMQTAQLLNQTNEIDLLRAGIWKPRTRPDSFEGVGEIGLDWLVNAGKLINKPTTTEVANAKHVELALKAGVSVLWIGARTTVNPFAVQEIADALRGVAIPLMIKNPINPDLELWIGAFERFHKSGITDVAAIHRGFSVYNHKRYRNVPNWEIPIALRERLPQIPIFSDPSHITGNRHILLEICQKAMDLNFDGLIIESHIQPDLAWSDAAQQVTPSDLAILLGQLVLRSNSLSLDATDYLGELRDKIIDLDDRLFELLTARMLLSEDVGQFKKENNITILQEAHWKKIISSRLDKAQDYQLSERFIRQLMDAMHQESIRHQLRVMNPSLPEKK